MRKIALIICAAMMIASTTLRAQEVKPIEASIEDYIALLNQNGYQAYSFDISPMKDTTYQVQFEVREYVAGNPEPVSVQPYGRGRGFKSRTMVKDFFWRELSEEELADIRDASVDYENGVYSRAEKITVGFLPCENDSTEVGRLFVENQGSSGFSLKLKPINHYGVYNDDVIYQYKPVPFKTSVFENGKFIPLAAYASFWFDEKYSVIRFCGAKEIDPDMSTEILKDTPHYYVIGVTFTKFE
ncbi:MAG: DUF5041 domain-containing protein [Bacteroidales bacterium]|nr:DUF5041 domain-containing protein [Bacteroidales bacterium]